MELVVADLKFGTSAVLFPPIELGQGAAKGYEDAGVDFLAYWDQQSLITPRSIWTPDLVPAADYWNIDTWLEPWPAMAAGALATERIEFMTVNDSIRRPPPIVAQLGLTMSHISKGRFFQCMGAGETKQFTPYGIPRSKPFGHLEECLKLLGMFYRSNQPITYDGPIWSLKDAIVGLEPYENVAPRLMVAGGPGKAMRFAATLADGWMTYVPNCASPEQYAEQVAELKRISEQAGKDPDKLIIMAGLANLISESESTLDEIAANAAIRWETAAMWPDGESFRRVMGRDNPLGAEWSYPRDLIPMGIPREYALSIVDQITPDDVRRARFLGTPEQVADQVEPYLEAGVTHLLSYNFAGFVDLSYTDGVNRAETQFFDILRKRHNTG
jgi:phthiodiolone/phenolphthiodiolone dimycocerosates ketoreductase